MAAVATLSPEAAETSSPLAVETLSATDGAGLIGKGGAGLVNAVADQSKMRIQSMTNFASPADLLQTGISRLDKADQDAFKGLVDTVKAGKPLTPAQVAKADELKDKATAPGMMSRDDAGKVDALAKTLIAQNEAKAKAALPTAGAATGAAPAVVAALPTPAQAAPAPIAAASSSRAGSNRSPHRRHQHRLLPRTLTAAGHVCQHLRNMVRRVLQGIAGPTGRRGGAQRRQDHRRSRLGRGKIRPHKEIIVANHLAAGDPKAHLLGA